MITLLLIEDNIEIIAGIEKHIDFHSLNVLYLGSCQNGKQGFDLISSLKPDIVLCDIELPSMTGIEIIQQTYELNQDTKFIIISGHNEFSYAQMAIKYDVLEYLLKPVFPFDIEKAIKNAVAKIHSKNTYGVSDRAESGSVHTSENFFLNQSNTIRTSNTTVMKALNYIHSQYMNIITLTDIAQKLFISPNHLRNLFIKETGLTFNDYLTQYRMSVAKVLLSSKKYKVYEVANFVGYNDIHSFRKTFKKTTGSSPSDFI